MVFDLFGVDGEVDNPFAGRTQDGDWLTGTTSVEFLNRHFGRFKTLDECIQATESEGLKLFFEYLKAQE